MLQCPLLSMGTPFFISKLKFSYDKYSVDKVWAKIYCHFYFRGITLNVTFQSSSQKYEKHNHRQMANTERDIQRATLSLLDLL